MSPDCSKDVGYRRVSPHLDYSSYVPENEFAVWWAILPMDSARRSRLYFTVHIWSEEKENEDEEKEDEEKEEDIILKGDAFRQAFNSSAGSTGNYWQRLPEIACQQYHQAAKDVVISPKILQC
ncbi:hypothetical protein EVAR_43611_1 [Eumeta japonica]|uniref:Uncharacterized protein n=1 Tax=Eumeta variegata TaxID=151549 RepID=A0A4C1XER8_EUMVA|nr:hypothetical protein EVAR_43611_1 [Eumeta japonica]